MSFDLGGLHSGLLISNFSFLNAQNWEYLWFINSWKRCHAKAFFVHILSFSIWDRLVKIAKVQNSGNFWRRLSLENGLFSLGKQFHGDWRGHLHQISQLDFIKVKHGCISYIKMQNPICSWMFQMCFCVLDLVKMHHPSIHPSTHPSVFCEQSKMVNSLSLPPQRIISFQRKWKWKKQNGKVKVKVKKAKW